jgi:type I restriction enzyme S subunit
MPQQQQIADVLDRAGALCAKRRKSGDLLEQLARAVFVSFFGDPRENPKGWPERPLGGLAQLYGGASLPTGEAFTGQRNGYLLMKVSDMNLPGNEVVVSASRLWSDRRGSKAATCPEGSIVIPKRGAAIATNKKRLVNRPCVLDPNLMAIKADERTVLADYLYAWFAGFDLSDITSGSSVPQLNKQDLNPLTVPVPPLDLQRSYVAALRQLDVVRARRTRHAEALQRLFESLQQRAFSGQL